MIGQCDPIKLHIQLFQINQNQSLNITGMTDVALFFHTTERFL